MKWRFRFLSSVVVAGIVQISCCGNRMHLRGFPRILEVEKVGSSRNDVKVFEFEEFY